MLLELKKKMMQLALNIQFLTTNMAGKCPNVLIKTPCFVVTNTAEIYPDIPLKTLCFVATKTAVKMHSKLSVATRKECWFHHDLEHSAAWQLSREAYMMSMKQIKCIHGLQKQSIPIFFF